MRDMSREPEQPRPRPSYEDLVDLVASQCEGIAKLHETIEQQAALIAELQEAATPGRWWRPKGRLGNTGAASAGLTARVEAILKLAETEADALRTEARRAAAEYIAEAERDAERIRAEAAVLAHRSAEGLGEP